MTRISSPRGFTMVEMLVGMAVLGLLMAGMAQFYSTFVQASRQSRAYASIDENLTLVMEKMTSTIQTAAKVGRAPGKNPYELIGIDGDGKFVSSGDTAHKTLAGSSPTPNDYSDRLHFHGLQPMKLSRRNMGKQSDRVYYAFWINGEGSPTPANALRNNWGIMMRKRYHTGSDTLPRYPTKNDALSPVLDLNKGSTVLDSVPENRINNVLGRNIDYLSFRYYDPKQNRWENEWDTAGSEDGRFPAAVQVAIRGYDYRANQSAVTTDQTVPPQWHSTTISLSGSN